MKPLIPDTKRKELLQSAVVIIDSREKENKHVTDYFDKKGINYIVKKLDYGDYTLLLPSNDIIPYDTVLDFAVERKRNLEELSGNLTKGRTTIENELIRGAFKMTMVIENSTLNDVMRGRYNTEYSHKSFLASLLSFYCRHGIGYWFTEKADSGRIIYEILYYRLREELK